MDLGDFSTLRRTSRLVDYDDSLLENLFELGMDMEMSFAMDHGADAVNTSANVKLLLPQGDQIQLHSFMDQGIIPNSSRHHNSLLPNIPLPSMSESCLSPSLKSGLTPESSHTLGVNIECQNCIMGSQAEFEVGDENVGSREGID